jgi:Zn finger protein HypA/HybF involved in hydrogenase expression
MHDLHEANKILKTILDYAKQNNLKKVTKAIISLGKIEEHGQEILPDNIKFNIKILAKDTCAENLDLIIKQSNTDAWELKEIEGE